MSKHMSTPALSNIINVSDNSATFVIEPLHTGYGMTLGNSLRRVLMSSIAGASITGFRIEGVTHEFTTVKGVKEDVVDIMLNLKAVRVKSFSQEPVEIKLEANGAGIVTAKSFEKNADIEIVNPEQVIATLDDPKSKLVIYVKIEVGRGFRPAEESASKKTSTGLISIDAIFSPIERVRYKVENTRVGQITNLDSLKITVDTDGTISPQDAFEEAAAILIHQYEALAGSTRVAFTEPAEEATSASDAESEDLNTAIEDLNLSARTTNALLNNNIKSIRDLVTLSDTELKELKGFGSKALDEVKDRINELTI